MDALYKRRILRLRELLFCSPREALTIPESVNARTAVPCRLRTDLQNVLLLMYSHTVAVRYIVRSQTAVYLSMLQVYTFTHMWGERKVQVSDFTLWMYSVHAQRQVSQAVAQTITMTKI